MTCLFFVYCCGFCVAIVGADVFGFLVVIDILVAFVFVMMFVCVLRAFGALRFAGCYALSLALLF